MEFALIATGLLVGLAQGFAGAGSAVIAVTVLVLALQALPPAAVGTALAVVTVSRAISAALSGRLHLADRAVALRYGLAGALGAAAGALLSHPILMSAFPYPEEMVFKVVAVGIGLIGIHLTLWPEAGMAAAPERPSPTPKQAPISNPVAIAFGIGVIAGLSGVGSGLFLIGLLASHRHELTGDLRGTLLLTGTLVAGAGAAVHSALGHVDGALAQHLLMGAVPGTVIGIACSAAYAVVWQSRADRRIVDAILKQAQRQ